MKTIPNTLYTLMLVGSMFVLASCSGDGTEVGATTSELPLCSADVRDTSAAKKVAASTSIESLTEETVVRVWHYDNGDKLACVVTGSAIFVR